MPFPLSLNNLLARARFDPPPPRVGGTRYVDEHELERRERTSLVTAGLLRTRIVSLSPADGLQIRSDSFTTELNLPSAASKGHPSKLKSAISMPHYPAGVTPAVPDGGRAAHTQGRPGVGLISRHRVPSCSAPLPIGPPPLRLEGGGGRREAVHPASHLPHGWH